MKTEFIHELKVPFEYHLKGQLEQARTITVKAPNNSVLNFNTIIEQEFNISELKAMDIFKNAIGEEKFNKIVNEKDPEEAKKEFKKQSEEDPEKTALDIINKIMIGGDANKCFIGLQEILRSKGMSLIDDEVEITKPLFDKMHPLDTKIILGKYIENFIVSSQGN